MSVLRSLGSIIVESSELSRDRFILDVFAVGFCLGVGFLTLSLVVIADCVDVFVVVVVVGGFAVVSADVVVGLLTCFFGFWVVAVGCCCLLFFSDCKESAGAVWREGKARRL